MLQKQVNKHASLQNDASSQLRFTIYHFNSNIVSCIKIRNQIFAPNLCFPICPSRLKKASKCSVSNKATHFHLCTMRVSNTQSNIPAILSTIPI